MTHRENPALDAQTLAAIRECRARRGVPPTIRELRDELGLRSTAPVQYRLERLEARGLIRRGRKQARALAVRP